MQSSPGIKDVALRAGVSLGTVSNFLNRPDRLASATRQRVSAAIDELGFVRNDSARQLRARRSRTVAYVVPDATNPFYADVQRGVTEAADRAGLTVFLCDCALDASRQAAFLELLDEQRVEGILISPVDAADPRIARLAARGTPVVLVDAASPQLCSVTVDDVLGADLAVSHMLERRHSRVAFVGGPPTAPQVADRLAGSRTALGRVRPELELLVIETGTSDIAAGRHAGSRLAGIPAGRRPTAAFCVNDLVAIGLLQQVVQLGLTVPDDLAIVGYDDIDFAEAAAVPLTSVSQPRNQLGRVAAEMLLAEARGTTDHQHAQVAFAPELVVRASSGARPGFTATT